MMGLLWDEMSTRHVWQENALGEGEKGPGNPAEACLPSELWRNRACLG